MKNVLYILMIVGLFLTGCEIPNPQDDTTKPIITLLGESTVTLNVGQTYTDAGATASDDIDGDITSKINVAGLPVDMSVAATHTLTYTVSDKAGNAADSVTRVVTVEEEFVYVPTIVTKNQTYHPKDTVSVSIEGTLSGDQDWAGIYPADANSSWDNVIAWNWVHEGENIFNKDMKEMPAGAYEVRLFFHNATDVPEAKNTFSVEAAQKEYGKAGTHPTDFQPKEITASSTVYYPTDLAEGEKVPVIFFASGWHSKAEEYKHTDYSALLSFIASQGYYVIYLRQGWLNDRTFPLYQEVLDQYADHIDTTRIGVVGHSLGGGNTFKILDYFSNEKHYGEEGRFIMVIEGWYAWQMNQEDMKKLPDNTHIVMQQYGPKGNNIENNTDPRIVLTEYYMLDSIPDNQKDYQIYEDADHKYPYGDGDYSSMQIILKPLDALMEYAFVGTPEAHDISLEQGNDDPYANGEGIQEVKPIDVYASKCNGSDTHTNIDYCNMLQWYNEGLSKVVPYAPEALPEDMLKDEAMNMDPNHPKFANWTNPENINNGVLQLIGQYDDSSYTVPREIWLPHHKYTVVWDMETTGNVSEDAFPVVRFSFLGYFSQGYQNAVLNQKETLYTVIASDDNLVNDSHKGFGFSRRDTLGNSTLNISNIRIYDGVIEIEKPVLKETHFEGTVTMDKEGVFRRNGKVIFPMNIYKDNTLITRGIRTIDQYLEKGITGTIMEAHSEHWDGAREEKLSKMIAGGMTTMSVPITNYLKNPDYAVGTGYFNDFSSVMQTLEQNASMWNGIAALSIDNEFYHKNQQFRDSIAKIRETIPGKPIQMLNGTEAISAWYNDYIDITGTYIAYDNGVEKDHLEAVTNIHIFEAQRLSPNLHVPATLLQVNQGTGENFGSILMAGVALGGTKLEYWKDDDELFNGFRNLNMPELPMWNQLPTLRTYLDKMCDIGIIETTPYIGFKVKQTNDKYEYIKARLGNENKAYIIASNMTSLSDERTVSFSQPYEGLHYVPSGVLKDIITGEEKGRIDVNTKTVNITLAPHTWVVLEVEAK